mmetsp:Transcript_19184/g.30385  ORF Transcript_19184/g.30385 Transcript_19184/m.30385 type:complete len:251 (-) Transcript_19184:124-876(-)
MESNLVQSASPHCVHCICSFFKLWILFVFQTRFQFVHCALHTLRFSAAFGFSQQWLQLHGIAIDPVVISVTPAIIVDLHAIGSRLIFVYQARIPFMHRIQVIASPECISLMLCILFLLCSQSFPPLGHMRPLLNRFRQRLAKLTESGSRQCKRIRTLQDILIDISVAADVLRRYSMHQRLYVQQCAVRRVLLWFHLFDHSIPPSIAHQIIDMRADGQFTGSPFVQFVLFGFRQFAASFLSEIVTKDAMKW